MSRPAGERGTARERSTFLGLPRAVNTEHLHGQPFPVAARAAVADTQLRRNLGNATATIRAKRARVVGEVPDWAALRAAGAAIKDSVLANLDELLVQLESEVTRRGGTVHWARDAAEANAIVTSLVRATGADEVVKVKSMATQEIGLNEALEAAGIAAWETDLAELIVQLGHDKPSHILVPAIHRNRAEIREIFLREMARRVPPRPTSPTSRAALAEAARRAPAAEVPARPGGDLRGELRGRGDRDAVAWSSPRATGGCA